MEISSKTKTLSLDLEFNILTRLSLKNLYRFKCVCKDWRDLINSQLFLKRHRQQHAIRNSDSTIVLVEVGQSILSYESHADILTDLTCYVSSFAKSIYKVPIGSCNGLLCFDEYRDALFFVYNPLTGACKKITRYVAEARGIERYRWIMRFGFGYDCFNDDYKLLSIYTDGYKDEGAHVYSFKANSWKVIKNHLIICRGIFSHDHLISNNITMSLNNNALHWLISGKECRHKFIIASFDLRMEEYRQMLPPVGLLTSEYDSRVNLTAPGSCLHILHYSKRLLQMEVWVMKEYGVQESWTKIFQSSYIKQLRRGIPLPCAYSEDGQEIIVALQGHTKTFLHCNLERQEVSNVQFLSSDNDRKDYSFILPLKGFLGSFIDD